MCVWILLGGGLLLFNLAYWLFTFWGLMRVPTSSNCPINAGGTSLIVVVRNPSKGFEQSVREWLNQTPAFQSIVIVDDDSDVPISEILQESEFLNVSICRLTNTEPGKKQGLKEGLRLVDSPYALLTDADGRPSDDSWSSRATSFLHSKRGDVLLLYAPYFTEKGWFSRLVRLENVVTALQYFAWWSIGKPYMSVGRNVLYSRSAYGQFDFDPNEPASGDDDLFFQKLNLREGTYALLDPKTFVYSRGPSTALDWLDQKSRHLTTSNHYPLIFKLFLGGFSLSQVAHLIAFALVVSGLWVEGIWYLLFRTVLLIIFSKKPLARLKATDLHWYLPILELLLAVYLILVAPLTLLRDSKKWTWNE